LPQEEQGDAIMSKALVLFSLLTFGTAHAAIVATADGVVTNGCNDCTGSGFFDPFGLGANYDLTGAAFSIQFNVTDAALATPPLYGAYGSDFVWSPETPFLLSASITLNGHTYDLPANSPVEPWFGYLLDGSVTMHVQNEDPYEPAPAGYDPARYGSYYYDFFRAEENSTASFVTQAYAIDRQDPSSSVLLSHTRFVGHIGDVAVTTVSTGVPEPGTWGLMCVGLAGLALMHWRRRRQPQL
jgi:PEP-CTERM motif